MLPLFFCFSSVTFSSSKIAPALLITFASFRAQSASGYEFVQSCLFSQSPCCSYSQSILQKRQETLPRTTRLKSALYNVLQGESVQSRDTHAYPKHEILCLDCFHPHIEDHHSGEDASLCTFSSDPTSNFKFWTSVRWDPILSLSWAVSTSISRVLTMARMSSHVPKLRQKEDDDISALSPGSAASTEPNIMAGASASSHHNVIHSGYSGCLSRALEEGLWRVGLL